MNCPAINVSGKKKGLQCGNPQMQVVRCHDGLNRRLCKNHADMAMDLRLTFVENSGWTNDSEIAVAREEEIIRQQMKADEINEGWEALRRLAAKTKTNEKEEAKMIPVKCRKCGIEAMVAKDSESYKRFKQTKGLCKRCAKKKANAPAASPDKRIVKVTCGVGENRHVWETTLAEFRAHKGICPEHRS